MRHRSGNSLNLLVILGAFTPFVWGCSSSIPEPKQPMSDAESASRSAREVGANEQPAAKLYAKLADEQIATAKILIADGQNERASYVLLRARADAELALALAREKAAIDGKVKAVEQSTTTRNAEIQGGKL